MTKSVADAQGSQVSKLVRSTYYMFLPMAFCSVIAPPMLKSTGLSFCKGQFCNVWSKVGHVFGLVRVLMNAEMISSSSFLWKKRKHPSIDSAYWGSFMMNMHETWFKPNGLYKIWSKIQVKSCKKSKYKQNTCWASCSFHHQALQPNWQEFTTKNLYPNPSF